MLNQVERYVLAKPEQYVGSVMQTVGNFLVRNGLALEVTGLVREMRSYGVFVVVNEQKAPDVKTAVDELLLHYNDKKYRIDLCCDNEQSQDMCNAFQAMFDDETVKAGGKIETEPVKEQPKQPEPPKQPEAPKQPVEEPQKPKYDLRQAIEDGACDPEASSDFDEPPGEVFGMPTSEAQELNKFAMNL